MKDLLSLMLTTYIFVLIIGALATFVVFVLDVVKWHSSEKKSAPVLMKFSKNKKNKKM